MSTSELEREQRALVETGRKIKHRLWEERTQWYNFGVILMNQEEKHDRTFSRSDLVRAVYSTGHFIGFNEDRICRARRTVKRGLEHDLEKADFLGVGLAEARRLLDHLEADRITLNEMRSIMRAIREHMGDTLPGFKARDVRHNDRIEDVRKKINRIRI